MQHWRSATIYRCRCFRGSAPMNHRFRLPLRSAADDRWRLPVWSSGRDCSAAAPRSCPRTGRPRAETGARRNRSRRALLTERSWSRPTLAAMRLLCGSTSFASAPRGVFCPFAPAEVLAAERRAGAARSPPAVLGETDGPTMLGMTIWAPATCAARRTRADLGAGGADAQLSPCSSAHRVAALREPTSSLR
jgi:hypothetical protein